VLKHVGTAIELVQLPVEKGGIERVGSRESQKEVETWPGADMKAEIRHFTGQGYEGFGFIINK
jgi:hypothetical protein